MEPARSQHQQSRITSFFKPAGPLPSPAHHAASSIVLSPSITSSPSSTSPSRSASASPFSVRPGFSHPSPPSPYPYPLPTPQPGPSPAAMLRTSDQRPGPNRRFAELPLPPSSTPIDPRFHLLIPKESRKRQHEYESWSSDIRLEEINDDNLDEFRRINSIIFPVVYQESFYRQVCDKYPKELSALAFYKEDCVGAVSCRKEPIYHNETETRYRVYIMTIGVLAPYRRLKIGSHLVNYIIRNCELDPTVEHISLHVQTTNDEAIRFYEKLDFIVHSRVDGYYARNRGVEPPDAYLLNRYIPRKSE
ncbi:acyl-CoA N-acyltransferase [Polychytrium aggregatum]|uniref:acyl-CoA N-acyltransferase n=1 Tax=Polychytrium aggregatum TaxID=110093 RepID=UPI0022FF3666|nr:acyl-CoA N-acyltransferase [Polychytrium aggregatum]KAI9193477.1 acyl-CoA N-acyltransferase [Polychytrium aggregatum]